MAIKINPEHKGLLRKKLHTPEGENIPMADLQIPKAANAMALKKEIVFARNAKTWNHKRK